MCCLSVGSLLADDPANEKEAKKEPKPKTVVSKLEPLFQSKVEFDAVVESGKMHAVSVTAEEWAEFEIVEAAAHGVQVSEGDVLVRFDDHKLRLAIEELEHSLASGEITLAQSVEALKNLEKSTPISLALAEKARDEAKEAYRYFLDVDRAQQEESAEFSVLSSENSLRNAQEELNQLEKMYKADDLTEETEEIILKRARFSVKMAERSLKRAKLNSKRSLKTLIPRTHDQLKTAAEKAELELELKKEALPSALELKRLEVAKAQRDRGQSEQKLARFKTDLQQMVLKAPADGYVFYGGYRNGKWATAAAVAKQLVPGGKATPNQTLMTVAGAENRRVFASITEVQVGLLKTGMKGAGVPKATATATVPVTIDKIGKVPLPDGKYPVHLKIDEGGADSLLPGRTVKISVTVYEAENAVTIPASALQRDRSTTFVRVSEEGEISKKVPVEVGFIDAKTAVIRTGLKAGKKLSQE